MSRYSSGLSRSEIYHEELDDEERASSRKPVSSLPVGRGSSNLWGAQPRSQAFLSSQATQEAYARQVVATNAKAGEEYDKGKIRSNSRFGPQTRRP